MQYQDKNRHKAPTVQEAMKKSTTAPVLGRQQRRAHTGGNPKHRHWATVQLPKSHVDADEYFYNEFERLYEKVTSFVNKFFCQTNRAVATKMSSPWLRDLPPEFLSYTEMVARADVHSGGWDSVLSDPIQRLYLLVGILARIFESKIFGELLFGATECQRLRLETNEIVLFSEHEEGQSNTSYLRYLHIITYN